jgi:murein DD-endopeptidase MepM/ murein hydrolase activator NlpD
MALDPSGEFAATPRRRHRTRRSARIALVMAFTMPGATTFDAVVATAVAAGPTRTCASSDAAVHVVVTGDTWFGIARSAGVAMRELLAANDADVADAIHPGDQVCLPDGATVAGGGSAGSCGSSSASYAVASGDSWFVIARRASTTLGDLLDANGATARTVLQPGDRLCLPKGAVLAVNVNTVVPLAALPVQGPCWYGNTWQAPRGGGRRHEGVDLIVTPGNYVYAVADGVLTRRAWDQPGSLSGNAWWLMTADGTYFFYAHLSDFARGLQTGSRVRAGQIIGFVGSTGNSATPHLHFEIHPFGGEPINPYPTVRAAGGCQRGAGYEQPGGWIPET